MRAWVHSGECWFPLSIISSSNRVSSVASLYYESGSPTGISVKKGSRTRPSAITSCRLMDELVLGRQTLITDLIAITWDLFLRKHFRTHGWLPSGCCSSQIEDSCSLIIQSFVVTIRWTWSNRFKLRSELLIMMKRLWLILPNRSPTLFIWFSAYQAPTIAATAREQANK